MPHNKKHTLHGSPVYILFLRFCLFLREVKGGRVRGGETSICERNIAQLLLTLPQPETWSVSQAMCPDWEWNWRPFALWVGTHPTEPHQSGQPSELLLYVYVYMCIS